MTNKDIFNYITFRTELERLLNHYVEMGLSATILKPVLEEALNAVNSASMREIEDAKAEIEAEKLCAQNKEKCAICEDTETEEAES